MRSPIFVAFVATVSSFAHGVIAEKRSPAHIAVTDHVLPLVARSHPFPIAPSSHHLHKRRALARRHALDNAASSPSAGSPVSTPSEGSELPDAIQQSVDTLGGRIYMTNITLAGRPYTVVIDTGSSDTWVASSTFVCTSRYTRTVLSQGTCAFGDLYDAVDSETIHSIEGSTFGVKYSDGEYLTGDMAVEDLGIGNGHDVRQTIGVVEKGWWMGDGFSSGLMGLAYPTLASNYREINYTTVPFTFFKTHSLTPIFSLALDRPSPSSPSSGGGGGLLAIGGIPPTPHDGNWVRVPITPSHSSAYTFFTIPVDSFDIVPPPPLSSSSNLTHAIFSPSLPSSTAPIPMVIDSGSTLLYLPDEAADYLARQFDPPARFQSPSNTYTALCAARVPKFGVVIGGTTFWIDERDMLDGDGEGEVGARWCTVAMQRAERADAVLGDTFLKNVVVVFDLGEDEVAVVGRGRY